MFFSWYPRGNLRQLPINAISEKILTADGATLKLDNNKNGWKEVCVYQEHNGYTKYIPVRELVRGFVSILQKMINRKRYLSAYWVDDKRQDVTADNMSASFKCAATTLDYPSLKGIPVERVETHFLEPEELMYFFSWDKATEIYKKWVNREGKPLRNIYERNCIVSLKACRLQ